MYILDVHLNVHVDVEIAEPKNIYIIITYGSMHNCKASAMPYNIFKFLIIRNVDMIFSGRMPHNYGKVWALSTCWNLLDRVMPNQKDDRSTPQRMATMAPLTEWLKQAAPAGTLSWACACLPPGSRLFGVLSSSVCMISTLWMHPQLDLSYHAHTFNECFSGIIRRDRSL